MHRGDIISVSWATCPPARFAPRRGANASPRHGERGMVLVTTLVIACLVGLVVGVLLIITQEQNTAIARSRTWCSEVPIAEAGIEEAMSHLNSMPANLESSGWTRDGSHYVKSRVVADGYFHASISSDSAPRITSIGYGRIPLQSNFTQRTVMVVARRASSGYGVVAKGTIKLSSDAFIDSFDSLDPTYSSNGLYTISRRKDGAMVGSLASAKPTITTGTGFIYGEAATGPNGTATGTIGDGAWNSNAGNAGTIQPDHLTDDFNMAIPDVTVPYSVGETVPTWPATKVIMLTSTNYVQTGNLSILGGYSLLISGKVRLHVTGNFLSSGSGFLQILPGGSLELYVGGLVSISGTGVMNGTESAANCAIYGLPTCKTVTYSGSSAFIGQVYTPQAAFTFNGTSGASGSFTANTISMSGSAGVHYDEALGRPTGPYTIISWAEL
jgi:hypothetical protein